MSGGEIARAVHVRTSARLHLGIFGLPAGGFGGLGAAVDQPNVDLTACLAPLVTADGPQADRARATAQRFLESHGLKTGVHIQVESAITPHVGLGSGTQLDLAVSGALARLCRLPTEPRLLANAAGRARRSVVGVETFDQGGFVVRAALDGTRPRTLVLPFPTDWAFVIALPAGGKGLFGGTEEAAFYEMAPMNPARIRLIHDVIGGHLLPALAARDIKRFGQALTQIQAEVGDYFAHYQGGRYSHPLSPTLAEAMLAGGACGVAQSSWGPALVALAPAGAAAERVRQAAAEVLPDPAAAAFLIAAPANAGAVWGWVPCG